MPKWLTAALAFLGALVGIVPKPVPAAPIPEPPTPKAPAWGSIDESHPQHRLAMAQQAGLGGAVLSFTVKSSDPDAARKRAFHVLDSMQVLSLATNLGDTKTTITHPSTTSHGRLTEDQRQAAGIQQGLIRVAVGLEHMDDITADLARGLNTF